MTLAENELRGREFMTVLMPATFQVYCYLCNGRIKPNELCNRYNGATWTHEHCPNTPIKTFAPHKYGEAR